VSKIDEIKNLKRQQNKTITPAQVISENIDKKEENNVSSRLERKRVSFDLRTDLHQELKLQSVIQHRKIYEMIEEALEQYLKS